MIELTLPYPVSANRYWRSYLHPHTRRTVTVVSDEAKSYKSEVGWLAKAAGCTPLCGRVRLEFTLHPQLPKDWKRRKSVNPDSWDDSVKCMDLDNAQKVLLDACKRILFEDDAWVREIHARRGEPLARPCVVLRVGAA